MNAREPGSIKLICDCILQFPLPYLMRDDNVLISKPIKHHKNLLSLTMICDFEPNERIIN